MSTRKVLHLKLEIYAVVTANDLRYYLENEPEAVEALIANDTVASFQAKEVVVPDVHGVTELNGIPVQDWASAQRESDEHSSGSDPLQP